MKMQKTLANILILALVLNPLATIVTSATASADDEADRSPASEVDRSPASDGADRSPAGASTVVDPVAIKAAADDAKVMADALYGLIEGVKHDPTKKLLVGDKQMIRDGSRLIDVQKAAAVVHAQREHALNLIKDGEKAAAKAEADCPNCGSTGISKEDDLAKLAASAEKAAKETPSCSKEEQRANSGGACLRDVACNLTAGSYGFVKATFGNASTYISKGAIEFANIFRKEGNDLKLPPAESERAALAAMAKDKTIPPASREGARCPNSGSNSGGCLGEVVFGFLKDIHFQLDGMADMVRGVGSWAKGKIVGIFKSGAQPLEDKTSSAALTAASQPPGFFAKFRKDPVGTIREFGTKLYSSLLDGIQNNFACEQWSGAPHASTCLRPYHNWACLNCGARMNMFCGVAGALGGEWVSGMLLGGMIRGTGAALKFSAKSAGRANLWLAEHVPGMKRLETGVADFGKAVGSDLKALPGALARTKAIRRSVEIAKATLAKIENSSAWKAIEEIYQGTKLAVIKGVKKDEELTIRIYLKAEKVAPNAVKYAKSVGAAAKTAGKAGAGLGKAIVVSPVKAYFNALDGAFMRGLKGSKAYNAMKVEQAAVRAAEAKAAGTAASDAASTVAKDAGATKDLGTATADDIVKSGHTAADDAAKDVAKPAPADGAATADKTGKTAEEFARERQIRKEIQEEVLAGRYVSVENTDTVVLLDGKGLPTISEQKMNQEVKARLALRDAKEVDVAVAPGEAATKNVVADLPKACGNKKLVIIPVIAGAAAASAVVGGALWFKNTKGRNGGATNVPMNEPVVEPAPRQPSSNAEPADTTSRGPSVPQPESAPRDTTPAQPTTRRDSTTTRRDSTTNTTTTRRAPTRVTPANGGGTIENGPVEDPSNN